MAYNTPGIARHLCRPTTKASARRGYDRLVSNINAPAGQSDVVNPVVPANPVAHAAALQSTNTYGSGNQTIDWTTATINTDGWWNSGTPSQVVVTLTGKYLLSFQFFAQQSGSIAFTGEIIQNGSPAIAQLQVYPGAPDSSFMLVAEAALNAGDVLTFEVQVPVGGSIGVGTGTLMQAAVSYIGS